MAIGASSTLWVAEIAGIVGSISFLLALAVVLATYDGKPVFDWHGVTLNAIISVLSTASKASLLFVVEELISQWKWIIFTSEERPLADFDRIDSASRGPLGSLKVLWMRRTMYALSILYTILQFSDSYFNSGLVQVGAIIVLLSIAVDPFTQQLVQYKQDVVYTPDTETTTKQARRYSKGNEYFRQKLMIEGLYKI